jgi:type IV fimbrial biogenesis protein FimT
MQSMRARSARGMLTTSLGLARGQAIARQSRISVCPSADAAFCANDIWWQHGWIVFADDNGDGKRDAAEPIIEIVGEQPGMTIATSAGRKYAGFRGDGTSAGLNLTFTFCDKRGAQYATSLVINNAGRARQGMPSADQASAACAAL